MSAGAFLALAAACGLGALAALRWRRRREMRRLQTLANLLSALREDDFSIRAIEARRGDPLGDALVEANLLADAMAAQRREALEATALLRTVMEEIDVAVLAFDDEGRVRLANRAAERLLSIPVFQLLGSPATEVGAESLLHDGPGTIDRAFPGGAGRFGVRRTTFRERGRPMRLVVVTNLGDLLREEERTAWLRLIRVLGHEMGNSLGPIRSIAESLESRARRAPHPDPGVREDLERGLTVVRERAASLARFLEGYTRLARLPKPSPGVVAVATWIHDAASLERRVPIEIAGGPDVRLRGDRDQLDPMLINLIRNAAEASLETGGAVRLAWVLSGNVVEVRVEDDGPGLADPSNLFVPFFTTKPGGSGIGLVLARQIAEAHGGSLALENRRDTAGCVAKVRLPV